MSGFDNFGFFHLFDSLRAGRRLSAAGVMLDNLDRAEKRLESEGITEELAAALRRADILSQRGDA